MALGAVASITDIPASSPMPIYSSSNMRAWRCWGGGRGLGGAGRGLYVCAQPACSCLALLILYVIVLPACLYSFFPPAEASAAMASSTPTTVNVGTTQVRRGCL